MPLWKHGEVGHSQGATQALAEMFDGKKYFDYPKPIELIKRCISLYSSPDSLILDFFSGSATTAHAVMQLNAEDGGKRKYICVQLPEETPEDSEARKAGYSTICEIGKERIRRAGKVILGNLYGKQTEILSNFTRFAIGEDVDKDPKLRLHVSKLSKILRLSTNESKTLIRASVCFASTRRIWRRSTLSQLRCSKISSLSK